MLVDRNARFRNLPVDEQARKFYGQLLHVLVVPLAALPSVGQPATTLVLGIIRAHAIETDHQTLNIHYYPASSQGYIDVVDICTIECLIGRVKDGNQWATIDRSDVLDRTNTTYVEDVE